RKRRGHSGTDLLCLHSIKSCRSNLRWIGQIDGRARSDNRRERNPILRRDGVGELQRVRHILNALESQQKIPAPNARIGCSRRYRRWWRRRSDQSEVQARYITSSNAVHLGKGAANEGFPVRGWRDHPDEIIDGGLEVFVERSIG